MDAVSRGCPDAATTAALKLKFECYIAVRFALAHSDQVSIRADQWG